MKFDKIHNKGQAQLFQNPILEFFTKAHPLVIWGMYLPVVIGFPYYAVQHFEFNAGRIALLFFSGMFFWTFFEYIMHRWV
ncbi:MAG: fatty acid hydroxylase, partial [Flavisolibacter sp.]|nr:fatty acid hydroxylase [Flavisolibacter sp.]